jgi:hypothetical protein
MAESDYFPSLSGCVTLYGDRGPDKFDFLWDGILDRNSEGTTHVFRIEGERFIISISGGRQIPTWQCPSHPQIPEGHDFVWAGAWEFWGSGRSTQGGCGYRVHGIYTPKSRKGVYHLWEIKGPGKEACSAAQSDLLAFFAAPGNSAALLALERAMSHMVRGSAVGGSHHVDCQDCWTAFHGLRHTVIAGR